MKLILKYKFIIACVIIAFISVFSLMRPGLPPTHDGEYHVMRFQQFYKVLNEGTLYPRWAPDFNNGFGIPLFNYVYPLPNYVAALTHFLGFGFIESFKLNMILATVLGAIFFYLFAEKYWGRVGGLVSSVFYTFSPYHLLDIYVRGSVGEVWSLGLAPGLLFAYLSFYESAKTKYFVLSSVFLALLILAHNILAIVFFGFFLLYAGFLIIGKTSSVKSIVTNVKNLGGIIVIGLGLSSIFWLPAILEKEYVRGLQIFDPTRHFPQLHSLVYSSWGYGFSGSNVMDQMSFQIGIANLIAVVGSLLTLLLIKNKSSTFFSRSIDSREKNNDTNPRGKPRGFEKVLDKKLIIFFLTSFTIVVFLITPFSSFIWKNFPIMSYVQFPWRLLSLVILIASFLAGSLVSDGLITNKQKKFLLAGLLATLSVGLSLKYIKAPFHHQRNDQHYFSRPNFTDGTNSPGNVFNTALFNAELKKTDKRLFSESSEISILSSKSTKEKATIKTKKDEKILVNVAYFPGWEVLVNKRQVPIDVTKDGLFRFSVPKGDSVVEVELKNTRIRLISVIMTILSAFVLFGLFVRDKYIRIKE